MRAIRVRRILEKRKYIMPLPGILPFDSFDTVAIIERVSVQFEDEEGKKYIADLPLWEDLREGDTLILRRTGLLELPEVISGRGERYTITNHYARREIVKKNML